VRRYFGDRAAVTLKLAIATNTVLAHKGGYKITRTRKDARLSQSKHAAATVALTWN